VCTFQVTSPQPPATELHRIVALSGAMCVNCANDSTMENGISLAAGEHIFKAGAICMHLYICQKGKVALKDPEGRIIEMQSSGSYFGQDALIAADPHHTTAVALTNCDIMFLRSTDIFGAMEQCNVSAVAVRDNARQLCAFASACLLSLHVTGRLGIVCSCTPMCCAQGMLMPLHAGKLCGKKQVARLTSALMQTHQRCHLRMSMLPVPQYHHVPTIRILPRHQGKAARLQRPQAGLRWHQTPCNPQLRRHRFNELSTSLSCFCTRHAIKLDQGAASPAPSLSCHLSVTGQLHSHPDLGRAASYLFIEIGATLVLQVEVLELDQAQHGQVLNAVRAQTGSRALFDHSIASDTSENAAARAMVARSMTALLSKVRRDANLHPR
jgi:Cyclic nucleotide-binding domain